MVKTTLREPKDATFRIVGERVRVLRSKPGTTLDVQKAQSAVVAAGTGPGRRVAAVGLTALAADLTTRRGEGARDPREGLLVHDRHGRVVVQPDLERPPARRLPRRDDRRAGQTFSYNREIGPRTVERGFLEGQMIWGGVLIPSIGGGVCQTATTIFNAAFEAGLPILARSNHAFYISHYPMGRDATVSWGGPEFVFRNDLKKAILIDVTYTDATFTVTFYGTKQGRRVESSTSEPTNYTQPELQYAVDPGAPRTRSAGRAPAGPGFDVTVQRKVYERGKLIREDDFFTRYKPENPTAIYGPGRTPPGDYFYLPSSRRSPLESRRDEPAGGDPSAGGLPALEAADGRPPRRRRGRLVALAAQIEIPLRFTPVPISGQTFAVLLVGASLGPLLGASSLLLYFVVGLLGAPVYSGGDGGWEIVKGATGGYLVGFIVAAVLTGWLAQRQVGPPLQLRRRRDALGQRRHLPVRAALAARRSGTWTSRGRSRPASTLRRRRPDQALPRRHAPPGGLEAGQAPPRVRKPRFRARLPGRRQDATLGRKHGQHHRIDRRPGARAHRLQPVDAVRGVPAVHGGRRVRRADRRHPSPLGRGIGGKEHAWTAEITEQRPDERVAWRAIEGHGNAGVVTFHRLGEARPR